MTASRRLSGRAARSAGASFEADVLRACRPPGIALSRVGPYTEVIHRGGRLERIVPADAVPVVDFHATVAGRSWWWDAKSTRDPRWEWKCLDAAQADHLDRERDAGAVTGILLRYDATAAVYWLPWEAAGPVYRAWQGGRAARGEASLTEAGAAALGRRVVGLRWFDAVRGAP